MHFLLFLRLFQRDKACPYFFKVLGALLLRPVSDFSRIYFGDTLPGMHLIIFGVVLILVMIFQPRGLQEPLSRLYHRVVDRLFAARAREAVQ